MLDFSIAHVPLRETPNIKFPDPDINLEYSTRFSSVSQRFLETPLPIIHSSQILVVNKICNLSCQFVRKPMTTRVLVSTTTVDSGKACDVKLII